MQSFQNLAYLVLATHHVEQLMERGKSKSCMPHSLPTVVSENPRLFFTGSTSYSCCTSLTIRFSRRTSSGKGASS